MLPAAVDQPHDRCHRKRHGTGSKRRRYRPGGAPHRRPGHRTREVVHGADAPDRIVAHSIGRHVVPTNEIQAETGLTMNIATAA
jgi:hypothetical protein